MKQICKTCENSSPTYKGILCKLKGKKVKTQDACEKWRQKK